MSNKKPNVLFILTDDQRFDTIHDLGNEEISTPNLDRLVSRGVSFTHAYIPGGTASAVCMPSRAMINSSRTLFNLVQNGKEIPTCDTTMCQAFRAAGYNCHGIGKWHNGTESYTRSFSSGEDIFFGGMWDHWNVPVCDYREDGNYDCEIPFVPNFSGNQTPVHVLADKIHAGVHSTELFSSDAISFINNYDSDEPFFLYLSYLAPHDPRTMPEKYRTMYKAEDISLPPNFSEMPAFSFGWADRGRDEAVASFPRNPDEIKQHIADYYAMISHIDDNVGRIIDALEAKRILDDTIIVFCGDNGLAIGQHGLMGKQNVYEHSVHIPLLISGPGIPENEKIDQFVYLLDVFPSLCEICNVSIPQSVEGKSFAKMIYDRSYVTRTDLYFAFQARIRGISDGKYKLIEYRTDKLKLTQLYDIENDPWETRNFYDFNGYDEIVARMRKRMLEYRKEWNEDSHIYGQQFWEQYEKYETAEVHGVDKPKGISMINQTREWSKSK